LFLNQQIIENYIVIGALVLKRTFFSKAFNFLSINNAYPKVSVLIKTPAIEQ
jgi:hypothetical protein